MKDFCSLATYKNTVFIQPKTVPRETAGGFAQSRCSSQFALLLLFCTSNLSARGKAPPPYSPRYLNFRPGLQLNWFVKRITRVRLFFPENNFDRLNLVKKYIMEICARLILPWAEFSTDFKYEKETRILWLNAAIMAFKLHSISINRYLIVGSVIGLYIFITSVFLIFRMNIHRNLAGKIVFPARRN